MKGDEDCRQLSLAYNKTECHLELLFNVASSFMFVIVTCANAFVKTNNYRLPINYYITFLPFTGLSFNWYLNYLFQAVTMFFAALVFFGFYSTMLIVLDHSCWAIDVVKLHISKLDKLVVEPSQQPQRKIVAKHLKNIHELHLNALKWNDDVQQLIQFTFLIEFAVLSVLICLCIYSLADNPFDSAYILTLLLVLLIQHFTYCWMGNRVLMRIDELTAAVYNVKWYSFDVEHMKVIKMLLRASQNMRGFHGIFRTLSMETFQQVGACLLPSTS